MYVRVFDIFPHTFFLRIFKSGVLCYSFQWLELGETFHQLVCLDFHFCGSRLVYRDDSHGFTSTRPLICQWSKCMFFTGWFLLGAGRPPGGLLCMTFFDISFTCCIFNSSLVLCVHFSFQRLVLLSWSPPVPQNHLLSNTASDSWTYFLVPALLSGLWFSVFSHL